MVRRRVTREILASASPKQKHENSFPDQRLLAMSSTNNQRKPAVAGRKTIGSTPTKRERARSNSAPPREVPSQDLILRRTPKSVIAMPARAGRRNLASPPHTKTIARPQTATPKPPARSRDR